MSKKLLLTLAEASVKTYLGVKFLDGLSKTFISGQGVGSKRLKTICQKQECDLDDWTEVLSEMTAKEKVRLVQEAKDVKLLYHFAFNVEPFNDVVKKMRHFIIRNPAFINDLRAGLLHHIAPFDITDRRWKRISKHPEEYDAKLEKKLRKALKGVNDYQNPNLQNNPLQ